MFTAGAGPVNSIGYCGGQCCNGTCQYDQSTGKQYCCALSPPSVIIAADRELGSATCPELDMMHP
jgi:hypothetical protein